MREAVVVVVTDFRAQDHEAASPPRLCLIDVSFFVEAAEPTETATGAREQGQRDSRSAFACKQQQERQKARSSMRV